MSKEKEVLVSKGKSSKDYSKILSELVEVNYPFILLDVEQVSETTSSGIIKGESVKREEMKTNHNTTVSVVAVSKDSSYKVLERVYVNAAMVAENHVPFKFPETEDKVFFLIDESLIFIRRK